MESKIKDFFLFFLLFNFVYLKILQNEEHYLDPLGELTLVGDNNSTFAIKLNGDLEIFDDYIDITLISYSSQNPIIYVATDENCEANRLYAGTQLLDPIHIFLKKAQINTQFYICIKERVNSFLLNYTINIKNKDAAIIPFNHQASYYISHETTRNMKFYFITDENDHFLTENSKVSFWTKGKHITEAKIINSNEQYESKNYKYGYVFYGSYLGSTIELIVDSDIGDYVTVGSTITNDGITKEMEENANEIMIASENEVCLPIKYGLNYTFITGKIYTKKAISYFANSNMEEIEINDKKFINDITNGIISDINMIKILNHSYEEGFYCLNNYENELMIFSIQMINSESAQLIYPILQPGEITHHYLMKNQIAVFYGMKPTEGAFEVNLNLKSLKGFPEMYYDECQTFPECSYNVNSLKNLEHPYPSNRITVYSFYLNETTNQDYNPMTNCQPLMIIYCAEGGKGEISEDLFCEFETTYFSNKDTINLYKDITFSQYLYLDEYDKYEMDLSNEDINLIYLDLLIFSGDADLELVGFQSTANKYYLSNKIFYSIHLIQVPETLEFKVKANAKTFYMVQYELLKSNISGDIDEIESGINYITSKDYDVTPFPKHLEFLNFKSEFNQSYLVTFYSPNCKFDLDWVYGETKEKILINDSTTQKIIEPIDSQYYGDKFNFYYTIIKGDESLYPKKLCIVYTSGLEMSTSLDDWNERSISLSEGVPHRYTFSNEYPFIAYAYHVSEIKHTLVINFNLIDKEYFDIFIYINGISYNNETIFSNTQFYIKKIDFQNRCNIYEVCTVIVKVQMKNFNGNKAVEIVMYQIDNNPFYLEKNAIRQDIIHGNKVKHYYFGIGKGEYGDITLDFKRGSGNIYASVEKRILDNDKPFNRSEWRGLYHFPMSFSESLKYELYGKKVIISENDTEKCSGGCYILISIVNNIRYYNNPDDETIPLRISIIPRIMRIDTNFPVTKVRINVNEFVVGNIIYGFGERRKYDYYSLILPYDSDYVIIDWQGETPSLVLNVGSERPTLNNTHFTFPQFDYDSTYKINKGLITYYCDQNHLKGLELTLGIYANVSKTMPSSPYAFRIFMPQPVSSELKFAAQILHIRSDQKVQCIPLKYKDEYICLFAIIFDDINLKTNMIIYPRNQNGHKITTFGDLVSSDIIKSNNNEEISKLMIKIFKNEKYKINKNYIYKEEIFKGKSYFFITTTGLEDVVVEILSSTFIYRDNMDFYPNPSTAQIFSIVNHKVNFRFLTTDDICLNLDEVSGKGRVYWDENIQNKYYLKGYNDRISLTVSKDKAINQITSLKVESLTSEEESKIGGFIFFTTYSPKNYIQYLGRNTNTEINYDNVIMPLNYYSQVTIDVSWTFNFNLYNLGIKDNTNLICNNDPFKIWVVAIPRDDIFKAKFDTEYKPIYNSSFIKGTFDSTFGIVFINRDEILKIFDPDNPKAPSIFLSIEKSKEVQSNFSSMSLELNIYSGNKTISEGIYIMNKLSNSDNNKFIYLLNCDINRPYFSIQYSANSDLPKFVLSTNSQSEENDEIPGLTIDEGCGSYILKVKFDKNSIPESSSIFFIVFTKEKLFNKKLDYFSFKYMSNIKEQNFCSLLEQSKSNIQVDVNNNNYNIKFYPIEYKDTTYYIKALYIDEVVQGEKINTIAISESPGKYMQINAPD